MVVGTGKNKYAASKLLVVDLESCFFNCSWASNQWLKGTNSYFPWNHCLRVLLLNKHSFMLIEKCYSPVNGTNSRSPQIIYFFPNKQAMFITALDLVCQCPQSFPSVRLLASITTWVHHCSHLTLKHLGRHGLKSESIWEYKGIPKERNFDGTRRSLIFLLIR